MAKQPKRFKISNIIFIVIIALLIIPQTRQPIQVFLQKGIAMFVKPSVIDTSERLKLTSYNWSLKDLEGETFDFVSLKGKKVLIVNTASKCGFTGQYKKLQALYDEFGGNDFEILGFRIFFDFTR